MALLVKRLDVNVGDVPNVTVACCTLHNLCDNFDESLEGVETSRDTAAQDDRSSPSECTCEVKLMYIEHFVTHLQYH